MVTFDAPSFSLGLTQDFAMAKETCVTPVAHNERAILSPVPISVCPPNDPVNPHQREGKRQTTKSEIMRSPFVPRIVDIDSAFTSDESKLTKYLFLMTEYDMS